MARYKKYEHLPRWLNNSNHNTLTPVEKAVLDTEYYCKPHGTKLSHQQTADIHHCSRHAIYKARRRLKKLLLRTTEPAKGSFLVGHPIEYENEAAWLAALRTCGIDPRRLLSKRKSVKLSPPLGGVSAYQVSEASAAEVAEAGVSLPQTPAGLTDRCSGGAGEHAADRKRRDELLWDVTYEDKLRKFLDDGCPEDRAKNLAQIGTNHYIAKRKAERKSREEAMTKDQRTENPKLD